MDGWMNGGVRSTWKRLIHKETRKLTDNVRQHQGAFKDWESGGSLWIPYLRDLARDRKQWIECTKSLC